MCIPNYFKLLSRAELKIPTESKVKEKYVWFNGGKSDRRTRNRIYVFLRISHCHNGIRCEEKVEEENLNLGIVAETEPKRSF